MSSIQKPIDDIINHIRKAETEALKRDIKINQIIIDEDLAITNNLYFKSFNRSIKTAAPMIFGLAVDYQKNLKEEGYNFIIGYNPRLDEKQKTLADYTTTELLEELQRRNEENE